MGKNLGNKKKVDACTNSKNIVNNFNIFNDGVAINSAGSIIPPKLSIVSMNV